MGICEALYFNKRKYFPLFLPQNVLSQTETESQTSKTNLWLPVGTGGGEGKLGGWDEHIHITIYKIDNQQRPTG